MSAGARVDRRVFVAGCVGAAGWWLMPTAHAAQAAQAATGPRRPTTTSAIIDPRIPAAAAFGAALSHRGARCHALHGDPYRFMRNVLNAGELPDILVGMGSYVDVMLATDVLREARYDLVSQGLHALSNPAGHRCYGEWAGCEAALQSSATAWPQTLAAMSAQAQPGTTLAEPSIADPSADRGTVLSWVMRSKPLRRFT